MSIGYAIFVCTAIVFGQHGSPRASTITSALKKRHNMGHQAGGDHFAGLPENSLTSLTHSLAGGPYGGPIQDDEGFRYLEFDIRENADGHLIVFHDRKLHQMVPYGGENKQVYQSLLSNAAFTARTGYKSYLDFAVEGLTIEEIKSFHLKGFADQRIPTLEEYLDAAKNHGLRKPLAVEVKAINTDAARLRLVRALTDFLENYVKHAPISYVDGYDMASPVNIIAYPWNFAASFDRRFRRDARGTNWPKKIADSGIGGVYTPFFHITQCR